LWEDPSIHEALIAGMGARPVSSLGILQESLAQVRNRLGVPAGLDVGHRVFTAVDALLERFGLLPRGAGAPVGECPDGVAPLAANASPVIQHEGARTRSRDAGAKARDDGI